MDCPSCGAPCPDEATVCGACARELDANEFDETRPSGRILRPPSSVPPPTPPGSFVAGGVSAGDDSDSAPTQHHPPPTGSRPAGVSAGSPSASASARSAVRRDELAVGTVLANRYEILDLIGKGGMGEVYKANDRELGIVVALKTIRGDQVADADAIARFKQELMLARGISHRNVVRLYDLGEWLDLKFLTMEFIDGEDLKHHIVKRGALPPEEVVRISRGDPERAG